MALSRETIYAALFARLAAVTLCKTFSRKWAEPQQISQDQQPALLCLEGAETPRYTEEHLPPVWTLDATIVVYARTNDIAAPGAVLSNILDQIEAALELANNEAGNPLLRQTRLGIVGVDRVFISGAIEKEDGSATGGQAWMTVPIQIVATM